MFQGVDEDLSDWVSRAGAGNTAGADPALVGAGTWLDWRQSLEEGGVELVETPENIIDIVWTEENGRPPNLCKVQKFWAACLWFNFWSLEGQDEGGLQS